ncbi:MAG TPA: hypothetical protein DC049_03015 [Spirochaetia bacterium]|nr:hypothetical protein [Spirochaetia bacterium]
MSPRTAFSFSLFRVPSPGHDCSFIKTWTLYARRELTPGKKPVQPRINHGWAFFNRREFQHQYKYHGFSKRFI